MAVAAEGFGGHRKSLSCGCGYFRIYMRATVFFWMRVHGVWTGLLEILGPQL